MAFAGGSSFALDFQQVIDRAVAIAALPLTQLHVQRSDLSTQVTALDEIGTTFSDLRTSIDAVSSAVTSESHFATVGDETIANVTLNGSVLAADYSLTVTDLGARTLTLSLDGLTTVTDPFTQSLSAATDYTLTVDGVDYAVTPASASLFDLAAAINASGSGAQATVVNIGGSAGADYRLSIQSEKYAPVAIQLNDGTQDLLQTLTTGSAVVYNVNGVPAGGISTDSRTVTLSPGVSVDLLKTGATNISISKTTSNVAEMLDAFVTAYNTTANKLDLHRGTGGGVLSGHVVVSTLARSMSDIVGYSAASGNIRSLADLGINLDDAGRLSLDETVLASKPVDDVLAFLGDATSGFLKSAGDVMTTIQDSTDGLLAVEHASLDRQIERQDRLIASNEERIEAMRANLNARMAAADAVIAVLEQQAAGIQGLFEAFRASQEALK
jgi:flagellar hook-associated protein 2